MALSPFCFVHAANVRLDQPMWGTGAVSGEVRRLVEEATNLAFEQIVETCLQRGAAFLLLTGNTLDAAHSHRPRMLFEQGCERLAEEGCDVLLVPGESDPLPSWSDEGLWPENVTVLLRTNDDPVQVTRDGQLLATVEAYPDRPHSVRLPDETGGLRIGLIGGLQHTELKQQRADDADRPLDVKRLDLFPNLVMFDYLALGGGNERVTVELPGGLAHDPGCPQPLDGCQTVSPGCSVVDVDSSGTLQIRPVPTAIVRREEIEILFDLEPTWDDLVAAMRTALADRDPLPTERLWLIRWIISGEGEVIESLTEPSAQEELAELVEAELAAENQLDRWHELEVKAGKFDAIDLIESGSLYEEFLTLIDERSAELLTQFCNGLPAANWPEASWVRHIIETAELTIAENVKAHARILARRHLAGEQHKVA